MLVGYARTSTVEQEAGLEAQLWDLKAHGCEEIFSEQVSSVQHRDELEKALRFIRKGDTLVVTKLDRLARSVMDLLTIQKRIEQKEANLSILNMNLDTKTPTGRLMLTLIGSIAQFEREIMLERQREGIAKAKAEGKYKGRAATARAKAQQVVDLRRSGKGATEIAQETGIGRASVYRILAEHPL
jgi:DNA invertase Pin-like site-specific DNA recombinase